MNGKSVASDAQPERAIVVASGAVLLPRKTTGNNDSSRRIALNVFAGRSVEQFCYGGPGHAA